MTSNSEEGFMHFCTRTLQGFELTIPGLHERMIIRMLRQLLENCVAELYASEANSWERTVEIFVEMRDIIGALRSMDPRSNASRLCTAISEGLDTEYRCATGIIDQHTTDVQRVQFFVGLYEGVSGTLEALAQDQDFMRSMGNCAPYTFAEIISRIRVMAQRGKNFIEDILTAQMMDAVS